MTIKIDVKDARVLNNKLAVILKSSTTPALPWVRHWVTLGVAIAKGRSSGVVCVDLLAANSLRAVLNDHLIAHPYEKDQFFAELHRLEDAIQQAESAKEQA